MLPVNRRIIFLRHGQSLWNLENRFTGWYNSPLTDLGKQEAWLAGYKLKLLNQPIDHVFTSSLSRASETAKLTLQVLKTPCTISSTPMLNERHYGALTGLQKDDLAITLPCLTYKWRRQYDIRPPPMDTDHPFYQPQVPTGESLHDTMMRAKNVWDNEILPLSKSKNILIVSHGNTIRALFANLYQLSETEIEQLSIPTGLPIFFTGVKKMDLDGLFSWKP